MKRCLFYLLAATLLAGCQRDFVEQELASATTRAALDGMEYYYYCDGEKIPLKLNEEKLFVLTKSAKPNDIKTFDSRQAKAFGEEEIIYSAPYFKTLDGADIGITNRLEVRVESEEDFAKLTKLAEEYGFVIFERNENDPSIYNLECTNATKGNALDVANMLYEVGGFRYAAADFIIESRADTNDTYYGNQWGLNNVSYPSADINYEATMAANSFSNLSNIIVAVVDNGIYSNHEDLPLHNVSYNAHTGWSPARLYGDHGTLVAGVIGATANNGKGVAGVASGVKIMPVSVCYTEDGKRLGIGASGTVNFANALRWAANNGADVINNSWSFDTSSPIPSINDAIRYAQGEGCVVVFASGNDNFIVSQPAAGVPETIVVGANSLVGTRTSVSNYGTELDVAAPGAGIWTTTWTGGYSYESGTSLAAPHVAGVAALMLSVNPNLTGQQVRDIIERSSRKLGRYDYQYKSSRPNGGWNSEVGYGLVDAYEAVRQASGAQYPNISIEKLGGGGQQLVVAQKPESLHFEWDGPSGAMGIGTYTYKWMQKLPGQTEYTEIQGASSSSPSLMLDPPMTAGTYSYYVIVLSGNQSISSNTVSNSVREWSIAVDGETPVLEKVTGNLPPARIRIKNYNPLATYQWANYYGSKVAAAQDDFAIFIPDYAYFPPWPYPSTTGKLRIEKIRCRMILNGQTYPYSDYLEVAFAY